jgi:hypothetical protein
MERWRLVAGHVPGPLVDRAARRLGAAIVEAILAFRRAPPAPRTRLGLLALRLLGVLALLVVGLELTLSLETVRPTGPRVAVLVDRSASMGLADAATLEGTKTTRLASIACALWSASAAREPPGASRASPCTRAASPIAARSSTRPTAATLDLRTDGPASDLAAPSPSSPQPRRPAEPADPRPLAGVLLLSDGLFDRPTTTATRIPCSWPPAPSACRSPPSAPAPPRSATSRSPSCAPASSPSSRTSPSSAPTSSPTASPGRTPRSTCAATASSSRPPRPPRRDGVAVPVRFEVAPDRVGQFVYEIAARPQPGEATTANNRRAFVVKVLRDKVRVLHVAGRPDWDVRALRTLLGRDPNVELLSYYILRSIEDADREDPTAELSLIAFPTDELFKEQLGSFDLVVLHNFDAINHRSASTSATSPTTSRGRRPGRHRRRHGPRHRRLPRRARRPPPRRHPPPTGLRPSPTARSSPTPAAATRSPRGSPAAGLGDWSTLPALDSYNPVRSRATPTSIGSAVLLTHPSGAPLLAIAEPSRGRSLVLATGGTWRLGFAQGLPIVDGARPYDLLWLGAVRWLLRDAAAERLSLETDRPAYLVGDAVTLRATALTPSYAPEADVKLAWEVRPLGAAVEPPPVDPAAEPEPDPPVTFILSHGTWTTDPLGRASETLGGGLPVGAYEALAWRTGPEGQARQGDSAPARARRVFLVQEAGQELARVDADPGERRLRALAEATGGRALIARDGDRLPAELPLADLGADGPGLRIDSRRAVPLWDGPWALLLVLIGLGGEVLLRRRAGLA